MIKYAIYFRVEYVALALKYKPLNLGKYNGFNNFKKDKIKRRKNNFEFVFNGNLTRGLIKIFRRSRIS